MRPPERPERLPETRTFPPPSDTPAPPDTLPQAPAGNDLPATIGRYRVLRRLGGGGMGDVYLARDSDLDRLVAVKVPRFAGPPHLREQLRQRFRREARTPGRISHHAHVCPVYDVGEHDGLPFVVMAYAEGGSLADVLKAKGRFEDVRAAVRLVRQAAEGVAMMHDFGHLHRDVKPGNILLDRDGRPLVSDFGLAKPLTADGAAAPDAAEPLTADGAVLGTPAYMAPEQAEGVAGPSGDVYGLGAVLYHLLTGRTPFVGPPVTLLRQLVTVDPPTPTSLRGDLCPGLETILLRALARKPEDRYPSAAAFAAALDGWLNDDASTTPRSLPTQPTDPGTTQTGTPAPPPLRSRWLATARRRWAVAGGMVAVVLCGVLLAAVVPTHETIIVTEHADIPQSPDVPATPGPAWKGYVDARVWGPEPERRGLRLRDFGALPLRVGDKVRLEAEIEPAAYLYVVLIDTEGHAAPLYPWKPGDWKQRGTEQPRTRLSLPEGAADAGWEIEKGPAGMDTLLLLARPTPLTPDTEADLRAALTGLPSQTAQAPKAVVWFENGEVVRDERDRHFSSFDPKRIDDPVLQTQALVKDRLQQYFAYTRAVSYTNGVK